MVGVWTDLLLNPIIVVLALVLGTIGEVVKRVVKAEPGDTGWRGVYYVTLPAHVVIMGATVGLLPWLPIPDGLVKEGHEVAGRLATGIMAGVVCKVGYDGLIATARRMLGQSAARASAVPTPAQVPKPQPSAPDDDDEEP